MQLPGGGKAVSSLRDNRTVWRFSNASMQALLGFLSLSADGPLVDRTGLQGNYRFELTGIDPGQNEPADPALVVPFDLQALGLKLQRVKVPTESWVIDRVQRPTAN